jgi:hypothetical protein
MDGNFFLATLALVPYFTSRAMIPLFASAAIARLASEWLGDGSAIARFAGIQLLDGLPAWFTSDTALVVLGIFALVEVVALKNPELREVISLGDAEAKALVVALLCLALATGAAAGSGPVTPTEAGTPMLTAGALPDWIAESGVLPTAGFTFAHLWALLVGAATWALASLRRSIYRLLREVDEDDDLGVQGLLSWLEDGIGFLGVLFAVILPSLALAVAGLTVAALWFIRRWLAHREDRWRVECAGCGASILPCALSCPECRAPVADPRQVGLLGTIRSTPVHDLDGHRLDLRAVKRCHDCGERLPERSLDQSCRVCGTPAFASQSALDDYLAHLERGLPRTLLVLLALGSVPVLGLVPGIIYYRTTLISALRCYLPRTARFTGRWTARIVNLVLICLQPVPILGAFVLPAMALTNYWIYRRSLRRQGDTVLAAQVPTPA